MGVFSKLMRFFQVDDRQRNTPVNGPSVATNRSGQMPVLYVNDDEAKRASEPRERPPIVFSNGQESQLLAKCCPSLRESAI